MNSYVPLGLSLMLMGSANAADNYLLDFGITGSPICTFTGQANAPTSACDFNKFISKEYGDIAGVVDVDYIAVNQLPQTNVSLDWYGGGYNDLVGVLFTRTAGPARVELKPLSGGVVTLNSFDMGTYVFPPRIAQSTVTVSDLLTGAIFFQQTGGIGNGALAHSSFSINASSANGLRIQFENESYFVGIDNIAFSVSAVPESSTVSMLLGGIALLGLFGRRSCATA